MGFGDRGAGSFCGAAGIVFSSSAEKSTTSRRSRHPAPQSDGYSRCSPTAALFPSATSGWNTGSPCVAVSPRRPSPATRAVCTRRVSCAPCSAIAPARSDNRRPRNGFDSTPCSRSSAKTGWLVRSPFACVRPCAWPLSPHGLPRSVLGDSHSPSSSEAGHCASDRPLPLTQGSCFGMWNPGFHHYDPQGNPRVICFPIFYHRDPFSPGERGRFQNRIAPAALPIRENPLLERGGGGVKIFENSSCASSRNGLLHLKTFNYFSYGRWGNKQRDR